MSPQTRTGLLAGAIVAFLLLCGACLVGGYAYTHRGQISDSPKSDGGTAKGKSLADRPVSTGNPKDDTAYILGHRWWKKPPTKTRLEEIVRFVIDQNRGGAVIIDETGRLGKAEEYIRHFGWSGIEPKDLAERNIAVPLNWAARPGREDVLRSIRAALDVDEYTEGPGR